MRVRDVLVVPQAPQDRRSVFRKEPAVETYSTRLLIPPNTLDALGGVVGCYWNRPAKRKTQETRSSGLLPSSPRREIKCRMYSSSVMETRTSEKTLIWLAACVDQHLGAYLR